MTIYPPPIYNNFLQASILAQHSIIQSADRYGNARDEIVGVDTPAHMSSATGAPDDCLDALRRLRTADAVREYATRRMDSRSDAAARNALCTHDAAGRRLPSYCLWRPADCEDREATARFWVDALIARE